jgi:aspartate/methionine/tyrosine aminotransferase
MLALLQEGDEAIVPNPGFPIYESMVQFLGAKVVPAVLRESNDFSLDVQELARLVTPRTRLLILNAPGNPCGGVLSRSDVEGVAELLRRNPQMWCLTDEIYGRILYEGELCSVFSHDDLRDRTILLDGFSKAYAMTGWRLGYGVMPPQFAQQVTRLQINATSCTATFVQLAGVEALTGPQDAVARMVAEFRRRRDVIVQELGAIPGFSCRVPKGAFYVFPNIQRTGKSSKDVERIMLDEGGVAGLSGTAFGSAGEGYVRFSYANSVDNIRKAMTKLRQVFRG